MLTQQQTDLLQAKYKGLLSQGVSKDAAIAQMKDALKASGGYDVVKQKYLEGNTNTTPTPSPVVPSVQAAPQPRAQVQRPAQPAQTQQPVQQPVPQPVQATEQPRIQVQRPAPQPTQVQQQVQPAQASASEQQGAIPSVKAMPQARVQVQRPAQPVQTTQELNPAQVATAIWNGQENDAIKQYKDYTKVKMAVDKARAISGMSTDEIATSIRDGKITEKQANDISVLDPSFKQKWEAAKVQDKIAADTAVNNAYAANLAVNALVGGMTGANNNVSVENDPYLVALQKNYDAINASNAISQEEKDAKIKVNAKKNEIDALTEQRDKIYDDLVKQHPGVPKSILMARAAEMAKPLNEQISALTREANTALAQYNAYVEDRQVTAEQNKQRSSLTLEIAKRYSEVQDAKIKAQQEALKAQKLDTKVETLNVNGSPRKILINTQTGEPIADLGADITSPKYQLTDYLGMKMVFNPTTGTMSPADTDIKGNPVQEQKLNQDYSSDAIIKGFATTKQAYQRVKQAAESSSKWGANGIKDISILYDFIKGLDPTSVVREAEVALAQKALSAWDSLKLKVGWIVEGRVLNQKLIDEIADQMQTFYDIAKGEVAKKQAGYIRRANDVGARIDRVIDGDIYVQGSSNSFDEFRNQGTPRSSAKLYLQ